jgi:hypothetical protein
MPEGIVSMDARQVGRVARGIRTASKPAWKALRVRLVGIGAEVASDVKANASYSTRIPGSVKVRPTAAGNVRISIGGDAAPNAVPIENKGRGFVRHPVFGKREVFTSKNSHPAFLLPAFAAKHDWALAEMEKAYMDAFVAAFERGV